MGITVAELRSRLGTALGAADRLLTAGELTDLLGRWGTTVRRHVVKRELVALVASGLVRSVVQPCERNGHVVQGAHYGRPELVAREKSEREERTRRALDRALTAGSGE